MFFYIQNNPSIAPGLHSQNLHFNVSVSQCGIIFHEFICRLKNIETEFVIFKVNLHLLNSNFPLLVLVL